MGLEHHGWYNPGSTWYGDGRRVGHHDHNFQYFHPDLKKCMDSVNISVGKKFGKMGHFQIIVKKVRQLAKLTVALNKFGRVNMFGPGTTCR